MTPRLPWDEDRRARLVAFAARNPRPSIEAIAQEFVTTKAAIQTAMWRYGITRQDGPRDKNGRSVSVAFRSIPCMCCRKPFASEGKHNRICPICKRDET